MTESLNKLLWSRINYEVLGTALDPAKQILVMETPGFSVDPDLFDEEKFQSNPGVDVLSPQYATATLVDRVPACARFFNDTGSRVSFNWKQLMETIVIIDEAEDDLAVKAKYDEAIEVLYGGQIGYRKLQKTEYFEMLDTLRENYYREKDKLEQIRKRENELHDVPELTVHHQEMEVAEYHNRKSQIEKHQAAILKYTSEDPSVLLMIRRRGKVCTVLTQTRMYHTLLLPVCGKSQFNNRNYVIIVGHYNRHWYMDVHNITPEMRTPIIIDTYRSGR